MIRSAICAVLIAVTMYPIASWASSCSMEEAVNKIIIDNSEYERRIGKNIISLNREIQEIIKNIPNSSKNQPIKNVINTTQSMRFGQINTQIEVFNFDEMIESGLVRDAEAVAIMYSAAKSIQTNTVIPKTGNKAALSLYMTMQHDPAMKLKVIVPQIRPAGCSIDHALVEEMLDAEQRIDAFPASILQAGTNTMNGLKEKYGSLDASKMTSQDKEKYQAVLNAIAPVIKNLIFENDLQNLRDFWAVAQEIHNDRLVDLRENGPDPEAMGRTEEAEFSKGSSRKQLLFKAWGWLNSEMPSKKALQFKEIAKEKNEMKNIYH